jgi:MFS transporter, Spinster family, sphingosine-1-phosphate transporter
MSTVAVVRSPLPGLACLILLVFLEVLIYTERYFISGSLEAATTHFEGKSGIFNQGTSALSSALILGYTVASPFYASFGRKSSRSAVLVVTAGLILWTVAVALTGLFGSTSSLTVLQLLRLFSGVGQAGLCSFAPAMISASAPEGQSTIYVGIYLVAMYLGVGAGTVIGGRFSNWTESPIAFYGMAVCMIPMILLMYYFRDRIPCPSFEGSLDSKKRVMFKLVYKSKMFWLLALGYGMFIFFVGGVAFWGPFMMSESYGLLQSKSSSNFGYVVFGTGILGTLFGGKLLDIILKHYIPVITPEHNRDETDTQCSSHDSTANNIYSRNDGKVCSKSSSMSSYLVLAALPFSLTAPFMKTATMYMTLNGIAMFLLFSTTTSVPIAIMNSVPEAARGQAMGLSISISHLFGDIPSPLVMKLIKDLPAWQGDKPLANKWTMEICNIALVLCVLLWFIAGRVANRAIAIATY